MARNRSPDEKSLEEKLSELRTAIRARRGNQSKSIFALIDDIETFRGLKGSEHLLSFLRDCGLSDDEATTYSQFTPRLAVHRERLDKFSLGFDAIKALVNSDEETVNHALVALETQSTIGATELRWLRHVAEENKIGDHNAKMDQRQQKMQDACLAIATARLAAFENLASRLYDLMTEHSKETRYLSAYENEVRETLFLDDGDDEQIADLHRKWPEIEANGLASLKEKGQKIVSIAGDLLKEFDELFPNAMIPIENWLDAADSDLDQTPRNFAESRHTLEALARGEFLAGFPRMQSSAHQWNSFDCIAYLAGFRGESRTSRRLAPRPVKKLTAITIGVASGAEAIGLDLAGFRVRRSYLSVSTGAMTIEANRRDWTPSEISIDDAAIVIDMQKSVGTNGTIELLAGPLPGEAFTEKRKGEDDEAQRFDRAFEILSQLKPAAFFFESSAEFLEPSHTGFRNKLVGKARDMGYDSIDIVILEARTFGIAQDRKRSVFLGVKKSGGNVQPVVLAEPVVRTVGETIADVAFPYRQTIEAISESERTVGQRKYLKWTKGWLDDFGSNPCAPDTMTLIKPRRSEANDDKWRKKGFLAGSDETVEAHENFTHVSVPLSIPVLKRLQGIPDDWVFVGSYDEQVEQICRTIPPVISRVLAHNIHGAISGEIIDLNLAAGLDITSNRWLGGFKFPSFATSSDPRAFRSESWRKYLRDDDYDFLGSYEFFG